MQLDFIKNRLESRRWSVEYSSYDDGPPHRIICSKYRRVKKKFLCWKWYSSEHVGTISIVGNVVYIWDKAVADEVIKKLPGFRFSRSYRLNCL